MRASLTYSNAVVKTYLLRLGECLHLRFQLTIILGRPPFACECNNFQEARKIAVVGLEMEPPRPGWGVMAGLANDSHSHEGLSGGAGAIFEGAHFDRFRSHRGQTRMV